MNDPMEIVRKSSYAEAAKLSRETGEPVVVQDGDMESVVLNERAFLEIRKRLEQYELEDNLRQGFAELDAGKGRRAVDFFAELDSELKDAGI